MSKCLNCGAKLSCGCQKRTASDGTSVCTGCLASYESKIAGGKKASAKSVEEFTTPKVVGVDVHIGDL